MPYPMPKSPSSSGTISTTNNHSPMRKAITLLICCCALTFGAKGMGTDIQPLTAIDGNWMSKPIPVNSTGEHVDVMTLMRAFHSTWPTSSVQAIIDAAGDNSYYQHDEATMPPGCHGIVFVDCEDFNWAYFHHMDGATQDVEARTYECDNGHILFVITFSVAGDAVQSFCCYYDYDPDYRIMMPEAPPFNTLPRKWADSKLHYYLGFEYDLTIIVEETSPTGENWYHKYAFTGMTHVYDHSSVNAYEDMDETDKEVRLPDDAVLKDEDDNRELYVNLDGVGSENGQYSLWLRDKNTGYVSYLFATENTAEPRWEQMQDGNGIKVPLNQIAAGNCFTALFIPWDSDKIFVEGCPDERNIWSYVIDLNTKEAIQLPTNEGMIAIDPGKREIHMSNYHYDPEGGRYSVERVYTIDGRFTGKEFRVAD